MTHLARRYLCLAAFCAVLCLTSCGLNAQPADAPPAPQPSEKDVVYGVADGVNLLLDTYRCDPPGPHPALVFIHGGGWAGGDKGAYAAEALNWAKEGVVCFSINYRFAPKFHYPAQLLDCARAMRWVRAHAVEYGLDPQRIGVTGHSAGGHLSLMMGVVKPDDYQSPDDPNKALSAKAHCVADLAGPADFTVPDQWPDVTTNIVVGFIGASQKDAPESWAEASPLTHVTKDDAPTIMLYGDKDPLVPPQQGEAMKAALDKVEVPAELIILKGADHGFQGCDPADRDKAFAGIHQWLLKHLFPVAPAG